MIKPYKPLLLSFLCLLMGSCDMIDYHPYDVRINGETDVNAHNIAEIEQKCKDKTTIKFVTMGDSQRWYDETLDFVGEINKRDDIDFVIHGGERLRRDGRVSVAARHHEQAPCALRSPDRQP